MSNRASFADWLRLLRPAQWSKNGIVLAAFFFARWDPGQREHVLGTAPLVMVLLGAVDFCLLASSVYILNDVVDRRADALHHEKRGRPVAADASPRPRPSSPPACSPPSVWRGPGCWPRGSVPWRWATSCCRSSIPGSSSGWRFWMSS